MQYFPDGGSIPTMSTMFDERRIQGATLELICFSANTVSLNFDGDLSITVESSLGLGYDRVDAANLALKVPVQHSNLMQIVGAKVAQCELANNGDLVLSFDEGHVLVIRAQPHYDSFTIAFGSERLYF
jgi:Family of unknown function (DUF6188)